MRSGPDHRSRGRHNGKRSFQPQQRPPSRNQTFDSSGPNVKIRGNARQIYERYIALAREAESGGDRVAAENLYQHAEHYLRVDHAPRESNTPAAPRRVTPPDVEPERYDSEATIAEVERSQPRSEDDQLGNSVG
jgi:hypothetical protein